MEQAKVATNASALAGIDLESPEVTELKAKLKAAEEKNKQLLAEKEVVVEEPVVKGVATESHASSPARWGITVDPARDKNEIDPVFTSVNGRGYNLKRGKYVEIPKEIVEVLNHAVQTISVPKMDASGFTVGVDTHNARRFPYRMHGKVVNEEGKRLVPWTAEAGPEQETIE